MTAFRTVRGIRDTIPSGHVLGRASTGNGAVELIPLAGLVAGGGGGGGGGGGPVIGSGTYLPLAGGTMAGSIAMGGYNISGGGTFTATTLAGTLSTAAQPNVTSLGTIAGLTVTGSFTATGLVTNADLAGSIAASKLVGSDIVTVGTLTAGSINWSGNIATTGTGSFGGNISAGTGSTYSGIFSGSTSYPGLAASSGAAGLLFIPNNNASYATLRLEGISSTVVGLSAVDHTGVSAYEQLQIAGSQINYNVSGAIGSMTATGLNSMPIGATTPSTGAFTNTTITGTLTVPGSTTPLLTTAAAITSGAGSSVGTLTNAPAAGNPTSWIRINDHGTTRYIPAW